MGGSSSWDDSHLAREAQALGKPMILEEFGLARDQRSYEPGSAVTRRDLYYRMILDEVLRAARSGVPLNAAYFWAWSGEGRPRQPGELWQDGDPLLGDPPHEHQGWYGVYDHDSSTLIILKTFAQDLRSIRKHRPVTCSDRAPSKEFTCAEQKAWNKCGESWVVGVGHCLATCGVCYEGID